MEETYIDELLSLLPVIKKRQISEYKMTLAIVQNPHNKDPKELWDILKSQDDPELLDEKLDKAQFAIFKERLTKGGRIVVK